MQFGYTILYVADVAATLAFYDRAFGLKARMVHESGYAELETGATVLAFLSRDALKAMGKDTSAPSAAPAFEIAFVADDVQAGYDTALAAGAKPVIPPKDMPWGQTISYVADPDGFLVEICSPVQA
jgi:catechol 2,3-dioxygenase-like lactoylglutathione lyase family enzyme